MTLPARCEFCDRGKLRGIPEGFAMKQGACGPCETQMKLLQEYLAEQLVTDEYLEFTRDLQREHEDDGE